MTTILGARGWECGNAMLNSVDGSTTFAFPTASTMHAKTGTYSLQFSSGSCFGRWALSSTSPSISVWQYLHGSFNDSGTGTTYANIRYRLTDGKFVELRWNGGTHTYDAYVDNVLFKAGTVEVSVNDWFHVQFYCTIADAGNITVLIDGHESINENGDTKPGAVDTTDYVYIYASGIFSNYDWIDNLVWGYGGLLGDLRVYDKRPTADSTLQWTPSAGADGYAMEDETPPSDTDYNEAAVNALEDEFELSALDITGLSCEAVIAWVRAKMSDGVGDSIDVGIDSNGTDSVKRSALSTQWEYYFGNVEEVDPDDSAAWNQAKLDALLSRKVSVIA